MKARDDFTAATKQKLSERVGGLCSNPGCGRPTKGPHTEDERVRNIGKACHIHAAARGGPRYEPNQTPEQRKSAANGIWLCSNCGADVDSDDPRFSADLLRAWKRQAEAEATLRFEAAGRETQLDRVREVSSDLLSWPQTLPDGAWIERPELEAICSNLANKSLGGQPLVLLGPPGCGKSALLARLGAWAQQRDWLVLAIKADRLPNTVCKMSALGEHLELTVPVATAFSALARQSKVLLLIDQLDALSDLVDAHTERLSVLLQLANDLTGVEKLRIVCSAREFDFRHDARFERLNAEQVALALPPPSEVHAALKRRGLQPQRLPEKLLELLRTPIWLKAYLQLAQGSLRVEPTTWPALLERVWKERVLKPLEYAEENEAALAALAGLIAEREELWVHPLYLSKHAEAVRRMTAEGILATSPGELKVGFSHQTFYEFARARAFLAEASLAQHVAEKQESLFVRPALWTSLAYLREADPRAYHRQLRTLWDTTLRTHLRLLLLEFLGRQACPDEEEIALLLRTLSDNSWSARAFRAVAGSSGWFKLLRGGHLQAALRSTEPWKALPVLSAAISFERSEVLLLLRSHGAAQPELALNVLAQLNDWCDEATGLASRLLAEHSEGNVWLDRLCWHLAGKSPKAAIRLVAEHLLRNLGDVRKNLPTAAPFPHDGTLDEQLASRLDREPRRTLDRLLQEAARIPQLPELAAAEPAEFLRCLLPWFCDILELAAEPSPHHERYWDDDLIHAQLVVDLCDVPHSLRTAAETLAAADGGAFLAVVHPWLGHNLLTVHHLLSFGLERIHAAHRREILNYLLADPRRLCLGEPGHLQERSCALVGAATVDIDSPTAGQLEKAICASRLYREDAEDAEVRRWAHRGNRLHQARLLSSMPRALLSGRTRAMLDQEERVFGEELFPEARTEGFRIVQSPMSAAQMSKARDADVLGLFELLHDDARHHPRDWRLGGGAAAAQEFGTFAKEHPERALAIIDRLQPGRQELAVGEAIVSLADSPIATRTLVALVEKCNARGFASESFRTDAARALENRARKGEPIPESVVSAMLSWLGEVPTRRRSSPLKRQERSEPPFLAGVGGGYSIPGGTHAALRAVTCVLLMRQPPQEERWLTVLAEHLERDEDPQCWTALVDELWTLHSCERPTAAAFLDRLFDRYPEALECRQGVCFVARASWWVQEPLLFRWLELLDQRGWQHGAYARGELTSFFRFKNRPLSWADAELTKLLSAKETTPAHVGAANAAARFWSRSADRSACTTTLLDLLSRADVRIDHAIVSVLGLADDFILDDDAVAVLRAFTERPETFLGRDGGHALRWAAGLVQTCPPDVFAFCSALVTALERLGGERTAYAGAPELVNLSVTLQRIPGLRSAGLQLFERLLELDVFGAQGVLRDVDEKTGGLAP